MKRWKKVNWIWEEVRQILDELDMSKNKKSLDKKPQEQSNWEEGWEASWEEPIGIRPELELDFPDPKKIKRPPRWQLPNPLPERNSGIEEVVPMIPLPAIPSPIVPRSKQSQLKQDLKTVKRKMKEPKPIKRTKNWELYPSSFDETLLIADSGASVIEVKKKKRMKQFPKKKKQNLVQISPVLTKEWVSLPEKQFGKKIRPKKSPR